MMLATSSIEAIATSPLPFLPELGAPMRRLRLERFMLDSMVKHFTAAELDALARFYGSAEGRSIMRKFGPYMADIGPHIQREFEQAAEKSKRGR